VHSIGQLADTHDDIARFEIAVDEVVRMDKLQTTELDAADISRLVTACNQITHQLLSQEQDGFDRELKTTANKEILEGCPETFNHHCIKAAFHAKPTDTGDSSPSKKLRIDMILVIQGTIIPFHRLEFNDDVFSQQDIMRKIYFICSQACVSNERRVMQCFERTGGSRRHSSFQPVSPSNANEFHKDVTSQ
jgi:hypothetical protein